MKKTISILLVLVLLLANMLTVTPEVYAAEKATESRAIAIVFDNSGSMYIGGNQAWCRATYAMEVFASMLNKGDVLQIYPMWPITVNGKEYTMNSPFQITDASQASQIREIHTANASGTPIESIDSAAEGLKKLTAQKKYMIILTDGDTFDKDGYPFTKQETRNQLGNRVKQYAGPGMTVMYLGIGAQAEAPNAAESAYFVNRKASNTADVLSILTDMCNRIFGRDTLPKNRVSGKTVEFDISMSKLIVFVQGENISNLKLTGSGVGQLVGTQQTKYSTKGAGNYTSNPDTSLQGMIVTYTDCAAGTYTIQHSGTATSIEVYYEPDADLEFVFTDAAGNEVDPNALYEGEYKVSYGMKDAKTGKLISSDLLGKPKYQGSYFIGDKEYPFSSEGFSGSENITLKMGEKFKANLTVNYLNGYTISKDSSDFGWPEGGITVAPRPAGDLRLEITGGDSSYPLQKLEEGSPYIVKVYYKDQQLTGSELEKVTLDWNEDSSNALITPPEFAQDHFKLSLRYKDAANPQNTASGECTVFINARYTAQGSDEAHTQSPLTYNIDGNMSPLRMEWTVPETYLVIKDLDQSDAYTIKLTMDGRPLTAEEFAGVELQVDCGGIEYEVTPNAQDSSYQIKLLSTDGIAEGDYTIKVKAVYTDLIGRQTQIDDSLDVTLSAIPLWLRWAIALLILLILLIIIWLILHIKVLPKHAHISKQGSKLLIDGEDMTKFASFSGSAGEVIVKFGGNKFGIVMPVKPGKESYLYKKQTKRYAEVVKPETVKRIGNATVENATIGSTKYVLNEKGVLERKPASKAPLNIRHGNPVIYSGTFMSAGIRKTFNISTKMNFKK